MFSQDNSPLIYSRQDKLYAKVKELFKQLNLTQITLHKYEGKQHKRRTPFKDSDESY